MKNKPKLLIAAFLATPLIALAQNVSLINLGVAAAAGSDHSIGNALNNAGVVVGSSGPTYPAAAFIWENGLMTTPNPAAYGSMVYSGINDSGTIAGYKTFPNSAGYAMIVQHGETVSLGALNGGGYSSATAINNLNQVVGLSAYTTGAVAPTHGFLWTNGQMTDLGSMHPNAINDSGVIVGFSGNNSQLQAVSIKDGALTTLENLSGDTYSTASAINSQGNIVGTSYHWQFGTYGSQINHATLWENGVAHSLVLDPQIASQATGINSQNQVVGTMYTMYPGGSISNSSAFLWQQGALINLDTLVSQAYAGWHVNNAVAINDQGQILANGSYGGRNLAMLITVSNVPEPTTQMLMAIGLLALIRARGVKPS